MEIGGQQDRVKVGEEKTASSITDSCKHGSFELEACVRQQGFGNQR